MSAHDRNELVGRTALLRAAGLPSAIRNPPEVNPKPVFACTVAHAQVENCLALIATRNYLPYAKLAAQSFLRHHEGFSVFLLLADGNREDAAYFPEGEVILLDDIGLDHAAWYATKFNASEFVNSLKPGFLLYLSNFADRTVYMDSDIVVFSRLHELSDALHDADLVLIPHMIAPLPRPEQFWLRPNRGDVFNSGLINAGCFAIRLRHCRAFLESWQEANLAVGAFFVQAGYQTDQQHLNWALVIMPNVCVLRETRYNVAYWNLHDRNLRLVSQSGGNLSFEVDGKPLGFFHFSGFDVNDRLRLSRHDARHSVYDAPALATILG